MAVVALVDNPHSYIAQRRPGLPERRCLMQSRGNNVDNVVLHQRRDAQSGVESRYNLRLYEIINTSEKTHEPQ